MKYEASFRANANSVMGFCSFNSKKKAIKYIREMAEGNRFSDGDCNWSVHFTGTDYCVASGGMDRFGRRYRLQY